MVNNVASPDMLKAFQAAYPYAVQVSACGLTEAAGVVSFNELTDTLDERSTTCGVLSRGSRSVSWTRKWASREEPSSSSMTAPR